MSPYSIQAARPNQIILDSIAEAVFTVDLDFRITSFNRAAEKITGIGRHLALGQACRGVLKASACEAGCLLAEAMASGKAVVNRPIQITRTSGGLRSASTPPCSKTPMAN
jgi:PAS domain S-box-containing protein